jgi:single stranded DNA-binding protein
MPYANAQISGNIGRTVETKQFGNGRSLHTFSVAVTEKRGERENTSWFAVNMWGEVKPGLLDALQKGAFVVVYGRLSVETWEKDGKPGSKTVITAESYGVILDGPRRGGGDRPQGSGYGGGSGSGYARETTAPVRPPVAQQGEIDESDLPF